MSGFSFETTVCLIPPAIGDSVMTAIAICTVCDLLQQGPPALVVPEHSVRLFRQLFPAVSILSYSDVPPGKWHKLVDFRADDVSTAWRAQCSAVEKYWFDFFGERLIQIEHGGVMQRLSAIPMLEGDGFPDALKESAYVMDLELLAVACGIPLGDCLGAAQVALRQWCEKSPRAQGSVVLVPCTSNRQKMWPLPHWQQLSQYYLDRQQSVVVLLGPDEQDLAGLFPAGVEVVCNAPWDQVCDIFRKSALVIANDCGPMHVAALLSHNLLAIFGPTDPAVWFPYEGEHKKYIKTSSAGWPSIGEVTALCDELMKKGLET